MTLRRQAPRSSATRSTHPRGGDPAGKIHRLLDYTARPGDVADPWYTGDFSTTWRDVAEGCRGLLKAITSQAM